MQAKASSVAAIAEIKGQRGIGNFGLSSALGCIAKQWCIAKQRGLYFPQFSAAAGPTANHPVCIKASNVSEWSVDLN
jgi:hypothetical protein